jgi:hypothetical protein
LSDEGVIEVGGPAAVRDESLARDAGLFASHSMLWAARAACRALGWAEPADLERLLVAVTHVGAAT